MFTTKRKIHRLFCHRLLATLLLFLLPVTTAGATELLLIYSNDVRGETDPCG
jgi:hypothetical protein